MKSQKCKKKGLVCIFFPLRKKISNLCCLFFFIIIFMQLVCVEMKRLMHEKMKEMEELKKKEHPDTEKYKAVIERGLSNLEKRKRIAVMMQNVLRVRTSGIGFQSIDSAVFTKKKTVVVLLVYFLRVWSWPAKSTGWMIPNFERWPWLWKSCPYLTRFSFCFIFLFFLFSVVT